MSLEYAEDEDADHLPADQAFPNQFGSVELDYPRLDVSDSSLPLITNATMSGEARLEDSTSGLGDSVFEHITDSDLPHSDSDGFDDGTVSVSTQGLDDVSSVSDLNETVSTSSRVDPDEEHETGSQAVEEQEEDEQTLPSETIENSGMTVVAEAPNGPAKMEDDLPSWAEKRSVRPAHRQDAAGDVGVYHFKRSQYSTPSTRPTYLSPASFIESQELEVPQAHTSMKWKTLRVLFMGDKTHQKAVVEKLASAMASFSARRTTVGLEPESYNIFQISDFASDKSPEVALIPSSDMNIKVYDCVDVTAPSAPTLREINLQNPDVQIQLSDGKKWISEDKLYGNILHGDKIPHVAVFIKTPENEKWFKSMNALQLFLVRHDIPSIVLSATPAHELIHFNMDLSVYCDSLRILQKFKDPECAHRSLNPESSDVPLPIFFDLSPGQLNLHLTSLVVEAKKRRQDTRQRLAHAAQSHAQWYRDHGNDDDLEKRNTAISVLPRRVGNFFNSSPQEKKALFLSIGLGLVAIFGTVAMVFAGLPYKNLSQTASTTPAQMERMQEFSMPASAKSWRTSAYPTISATGSVATVQAAASSNSLGKYESSLAVSPQSFLGNDKSKSEAGPRKETEEFRIQIIGCCHVLLKPPRRYTLARKSPQLSVEINRSGSPVDAKLTKLFDGVYEVELKPEDAYGAIDVTVLTRTKPLLNQTFLVDFGNSWLSFGGWKHRAIQASSQLFDELKQTRARAEKTLIHAQTGYDSISRGAEQVKQLSQYTAKQLNLVFKTTKFSGKVLGALAQKSSKFLFKASAQLSRDLGLRSRALSKVVQRRARHYYLRSAPERAAMEAAFGRLRSSGSQSLLKYQKAARQVWRKAVLDRMTNAHSFSALHEKDSKTVKKGAKSCKAKKGRKGRK